MSEPQEIQGKLVELSASVPVATKCLQCCGEHILAKNQGMPENSRPAINDAVTWAPGWQTKTTMGQVIMACVVVPSCMDHLDTKAKTPYERATESGLAIAGEG